jgi:hypothetical protein
MSKSKETREAAKPLRLFVNPLTAWTDLVLKGGNMVLASMQAAAARARSARVGVIPTADAPPKRAPRRKPNARPKAKTRRR